MDALVIDAFEFSRFKELREGDVAIHSLPRLASEVSLTATAEDVKSSSLHWSVLGSVDTFGHPQLILGVHATVQLMCQRCMTPFDFVIASESVLLLARSEEHADEIDATLGDDAIDVIVGSKALNLLSLVEDEALLAIPLAPKHDVCPEHAALDALKSAKKPSPFDVLRDLKQGN